MYDLINNHVQIILATIPQNHVTDYDWLIQNLPQAGTPQYQADYQNYWGMNAARLNAAYRGIYFQALQAALANPPILGNLVQELYQTPTHANGRQSLQFSFATKLLHMVNPNSPIYSKEVAAFYFFQEPDHALQQRIDELVDFHNFLSSNEYTRVLTNGLLTFSIQAFRAQFNPQHFTDVKIIDSLIWAFVLLLNNGALMNGQIIYH
jgi:hypothetical protein